MTHTPGPWFADASFVGSAAIDRFFISCHSKDLPGGRPEAEANARLIAAAPAMLEALRKIESATVEGGTVNAIARAAVAVATEALGYRD